MARRRKGDPISGWVCLDKPEGLSSTAAVTRVRRALNAIKAGHAGTLDPLASGVLPIALGEATKTVPFLADAAKHYRFTIAWGVSTTTLDREGEVTQTSVVRPRAAAVREALPGFVGEIDQAPPAWSAVKVAGARAYALARAGSPPDLAPRRVVVHALELVAASQDEAELRMECGKGAYVRALVRDLAARLGACGHVAALRRTRVGPFAAEAATPLAFFDGLCDTSAPLMALLPVETALDDIPALAVTEEDAFRLTQGRSIVLLPRQVETVRPLLAASRTVLAKTAGRIVALCEMRAGRLNPTRVFNLA